MEPTEEQFLVFNALDTLQLLRRDFYDAQSKVRYLETLSPILPLPRLMPDGEILPMEASYE